MTGKSNETHKEINGIHHITAIAGDPQRNLDFYTEVLGLRLVKLTVNFDDPGTYHFYFGDQVGHPGTILTFFPWANARRGTPGNGQVGVTAFSIPEDSLGYWRERFNSYRISVSEVEERFDESVLRLLDPDSLQLDLVTHDPGETFVPWESSPIPEEHAIRGFHSAALWVSDFEPTADLLMDTFDFTMEAEAGNRFRFKGSPNQPANLVDLIHRPDGQTGRMGTGVVHHIAWRTPDDEQQLSWRAELNQLGFNVTSVMDRQYFHSIYFREPGGVLFEIATDPPGFSLDEREEELGTHLKLPPWYESHRSEIEKALQPIRLPGTIRG